MSVEALHHPFWWQIFERHDARFRIEDVADVLCVTVHETENTTTTPDLDVTALLTLSDGHGASIRAHYSHRHRAITIVKWAVTTHPLRVAAAA